MKLRTQLSIPPTKQKIDYHRPIIGIGSCFIQNIGGLLHQYKFPALLNPFGILYNPFSIKACLERLLQNKLYTPQELVENQGIWYSFDHHGLFSSTQPDKALARINQSYQEAASFIKRTKWVVLTFGTATIYRHKPTNKVVANCHKFPNHQFSKERLSIAQIVEALSTLFAQLKQVNQDINILLTVSPVRHIKDGIIENQRSKATLLLAAEQLAKRHPQVHYFPAYELVIEDLRDYRFFEKDLVHPNQLAIEYIWEVFTGTYFTEATKQLMKSVQKIVQASEHRPFHPQSAQHQQFLKKQLALINQLEKAHPTLSFDKEKDIFLKNDQALSNIKPVHTKD